ncbi:MAG: hypothetical protein PVJ39_19725 [Gammaproteobacteria bacterium]|jgi:hypothetical protein
MDALAADTMANDATLNQNRFSQEEIEHLLSLRFINRIDEHLNIVSGVTINSHTNRVFLLLDIYYDDQQLDKLSFNLHNFDYEDIVYLARNIRANKFILHDVDNLLSGDIE